MITHYVDTLCDDALNAPALCRHPHVDRLGLGQQRVERSNTPM
jgi:hypothetical protein